MRVIARVCITLGDPNTVYQLTTLSSHSLSQLIDLSLMGWEVDLMWRLEDAEANGTDRMSKST